MKLEKAIRRKENMERAIKFGSLLSLKSSTSFCQDREEDNFVDNSYTVRSFEEMTQAQQLLLNELMKIEQKLQHIPEMSLEKQSKIDSERPQHYRRRWSTGSEKFTGVLELK